MVLYGIVGLNDLLGSGKSARRRAGRVASQWEILGLRPPQGFDDPNAYAAQYDGFFDEQGFAPMLPGKYVDQDVQYASERFVAERNQRLLADAVEGGNALFGQARGALQSGIGTLQAYRPGGSAALAAGAFGAMAGSLQSQAAFGLQGALARQIDAPDMMQASRDAAIKSANERAERAGLLSLGAGLLGAVGGALSGGLLGGVGAAAGAAGGAGAAASGTGGWMFRAMGAAGGAAAGAGGGGQVQAQGGQPGGGMVGGAAKAVGGLTAGLAGAAAGLPIPPGTPGAGGGGGGGVGPAGGGGAPGPGGGGGGGPGGGGGGAGAGAGGGGGSALGLLSGLTGIPLGALVRMIQDEVGDQPAIRIFGSRLNGLLQGDPVPYPIAY